MPWNSMEYRGISYKKRLPPYPQGSQGLRNALE